MKTPLTIIFIFQIIFSFGQSIEQRVIGSAGNFSTTTSGTTLSSTTGEVIIATANSGTAILTQGFQQPVIVTSLSLGELPDDWGLIVYPNPSNQKITVKKDISETLYADLIDVIGRVISTHKLTKNNTEIKLEKLASGTYFLKIKNNIKQAVQTFKIQKTQ